MLKKEDIFARVRVSFTLERTVSRMLAAWVAFAAWALLALQDFDSLAFGQETGFLSIALYTLLFFVILSIPAFFFTRFHTDSWALLAGASLCAWLWLTSAPHSIQRVPFALAVAAAYCLILFYCLRANGELLRKWNPGGRTVTVVAIALGLISCTVMALHGCLRYLTFSSPNFDFGIFCNMFYNMAESGAPMATCERDMLLSHFAVHVSPVYYLLLPFYWIFRSPLVLQIGQAVAIAAGIVPIVLLARHFKLSGKATIAFSLLYAFYPTLTRGTFYDLHENCFLTLFLLLTFLFYEKRRWIPTYLCALLTLSVKEDAAVYLLIFSLFLLLSERQFLHGSLLAALSVGYFLLCVHLLEAGGQGMMSGRYENLIYSAEDGLLGAIRTVLVNPGYFLSQVFATPEWTWDKVAYLLQMLLPLGLLPLCAKRASRFLLVAPLLFNLATNYVYQYDVGFQYHFGISAFLFYAALKNYHTPEEKTRKSLLTVAITVCTCLYLVSVPTSLAHYQRLYGERATQYAQMEEFLDRAIPEDASVAASTFLLPHIAERDVIYEIYYHRAEGDVDYAVIDARYQGYESDVSRYAANGYTVCAELEGLIVVMQAPAR